MSVPFARAGYLSLYWAYYFKLISKGEGKLSFPDEIELCDKSTAELARLVDQMEQLVAISRRQLSFRSEVFQ